MGIGPTLKAPCRPLDGNSQKISSHIVMRRLKLTFKSALIFYFVKFHFWRFLRDLYGNPANFKGFASATG